jgi:hypothetical protein
MKQQLNHKTIYNITEHSRSDKSISEFILLLILWDLLSDVSLNRNITNNLSLL